MMRKKIEDALALSKTRLDAESAGRSELDATLNYVIDLVVLLLSFGKSAGSTTLKTLGSAINGLLNGLTKGQHGLIGGLFSGLKNAFDDLGTSATEGLGEVVTNVLSS